MKSPAVLLTSLTEGPAPTKTDIEVYDRLEAIKAFYADRTPDRAHVRGALLMTAEAFVGVREIKSSNTGHWINQFHRAIGLDPGLAWCLMFVQYAYKWTSDIWALPDLLPFNVAGVVRLWRWAEKRGLVTTSGFDFDYGDIVIWRKGGSDKGHTGIVRLPEWPGREYETIEGNTGASWRDGGGIEIRRQDYDEFGVIGVAHSVGRWTCGAIRFDALFDLAMGENHS